MGKKQVVISLIFRRNTEITFSNVFMDTNQKEKYWNNSSLKQQVQENKISNLNGWTIN